MSDRNSNYPKDDNYYPGDSGYYPDDYVTITLHRKVAEDLYYALMMAMGGSQYGDTYGGKNGKNGKNGKDGKNVPYDSYGTY